VGEGKADETGWRDEESRGWPVRGHAVWSEGNGGGIVGLEHGRGGEGLWGGGEDRIVTKGRRRGSRGKGGDW